MKRLPLTILFAYIASSFAFADSRPIIGQLTEATLTYKTYGEADLEDVKVHISLSEDRNRKITLLKFDIGGKIATVPPEELDGITNLKIERIEYHCFSAKDGTFIHYISAPFGPVIYNSSDDYQMVIIHMNDYEFTFYDTYVGIIVDDPKSIKLYGLTTKEKGKPVVYKRKVDSDGNITDL